MILVADSGSTKTTWALAGTGDKIVTEGLNPHFTPDDRFLTVCATVRSHFGTCTSAFRLHFYGAGCGNAKQRHRTEKLLREGLDINEVHVETDMLGACRAASGNHPGLVGILGTGSNACYYDGQTIRCQPTSTGYILGDKGSANHVGRILLNDYLTHRMPTPTRRLFHAVHKLSDAALIDAVYHQPNPNRFLASLAPFAVQHLDDDEYCDRVIRDALRSWYLDPLQPLRQRAGCREGTLNVVGGFAKAIEPTLRRCFDADGLTVGTVMADPTEGLLAFHSH